MEAALQARIAFLSSTFGPGIVNKRSISVNCPECGKDKPHKKKLVIKLDDGMHHCWVCGLKGRTLKYTVRKYASHQYENYLRLFESAEYKTEGLTESDIVIDVKIPKGFILLAQNLNSRDPDVRATLDYAFSRGVSKSDLWYYKFGTCTTGSFRRRLIMPSFDSYGKLNYYAGRSIDKSSKMKYLNAKAPKKNLIFNEINIKWNEELTLVEGPMDLVKCNNNSVALLGSYLHEGYSLFKKIAQNSTPVLMALDPDATHKMQTMCMKLSSYDIQIRILNLDGYGDVGEMSQPDFLIRKEQAQVWKTNDRLLHLISQIKSGSLI